MSVESGSTRNTLGSQLSTTSSSSSGGGSSKDAKKEYWKKDRKIIRILTVVAYIASVSMAAVLLSAYYVFLWSPGLDIGRNAIKFDSPSSRFTVDSTSSQPEPYTSPEQPAGVLDFVQLQLGQPTASVFPSSIVAVDNGEDDDEYQPQIVHRVKVSSSPIPRQKQTPLDTSSGSNKSRKPLTSPFASVHYSSSFPKEDVEDESSAENQEPLALPLTQRASSWRPNTTTNGSSNETNRINTNNESSAGPTYDDNEPQLLINANTKPYRQRQIPTPSAPILITKTIPSSALSPTTTTDALTIITTTQPMMSLLWNASRVVQAEITKTKKLTTMIMTDVDSDSIINSTSTTVGSKV